VKYIHEQSWTLQNPEEISFQLDTLLEEVEETQASVEEIEEVFSSPRELLSDVDLLDESDDERSASSDSVSSSRERLRN